MAAEGECGPACGTQRVMQTGLWMDMRMDACITRFHRDQASVAAHSKMFFFKNFKLVLKFNIFAITEVVSAARLAY